MDPSIQLNLSDINQSDLLHAIENNNIQWIKSNLHRWIQSNNSRWNDYYNLSLLIWSIMKYGKERLELFSIVFRSLPPGHISHNIEYTGVSGTKWVLNVFSVSMSDGMEQCLDILIEIMGYGKESQTSCIVPQLLYQNQTTNWLKMVIFRKTVNHLHKRMPNVMTMIFKDLKMFEQISFVNNLHGYPVVIRDIEIIPPLPSGEDTQMFAQTLFIKFGYNPILPRLKYAESYKVFSTNVAIPLRGNTIALTEIQRSLEVMRVVETLFDLSLIHISEPTRPY